MYVLRQITARLAKGKKLTSVGTAVTFPYRLTDVLRKYVLKVDDGDVVMDSFAMNASDSESLQLPRNYTNTSRLFFQLRTTDTVKVTIVSPDQGTSNILVKGTRGTTLGDHDGLLTFCGTVTSVTITVPAAATADVLLEYFAFKLPDLTDADSYRIGNLALGVAP